MITEWLVQIGASFASWIASLFPELELPDELVNIDDSINAIFAYGTGLGAWVNWQLIGILAAIPLTIWALGLTVRAVRTLIAHIPFIGGKG